MAFTATIMPLGHHLLTLLDVGLGLKPKTIACENNSLGSKIAT